VLWTGQLIRQWADLWHWRGLRHDGVRQEVSMGHLGKSQLNSENYSHAAEFLKEIA